VKGLRRPPLDACDTEADDCVFAVSADWDAAQIMLRALPAGAAGGASLVPVPGVELVFDRASGRLSQLVADVADQSGAAEPSGALVAFVRTMFGDAAAAELRQALHLAVPHVTLRAAPDTAGALAALSQLARLCAARITSPMLSSPLWAVEAARLARQAAGPTPGRQRCDGAYRAVIDLLTAGPPPICIVPAGRPPAGPVWDAEPRRSKRWPDGWLDPALAPVGVFRHGLSPESDLIVRDTGTTLVIEAMLAGPTDVYALGRCRVRLVDSDARRVVATARFRSRGQRARAALPVSAGLSAPGPYWIEVVDDERRPVQGTRLRRVRRALRWADAALRAETRPAGLAPGLTAGQWVELAARAWDQCRTDWEAAGDADRAYLAAARRAALAGEAASAQPLPAPPSSWSARLACHDVHPVPPFLAEEGGHPIFPPPLGRFLDHHDDPPVVTGRAGPEQRRQDTRGGCE
jgi:hypothetical protein